MNIETQINGIKCVTSAQRLRGDIFTYTSTALLNQPITHRGRAKGLSKAICVGLNRLSASIYRK